MKKKPCRQCQQRPANRPNGLCYFCFRAEQRAAGTPTAQAAPTGGGGEPAAGDASLLAAMQHVQAYGPEHDRTQLHRDCRAWKDKKLPEFMARRAALEQAALTPKAPPPARGGAFAGLQSQAFEQLGQCPTCGHWQRDEGRERARKLLREQIARDEAAQAARDAELAARPGAKERGRALQAALWRERQPMAEWARLFDARRDALTRQDQTFGELHTTFYRQMRARALELVARPDPEHAIDSLERALTSVPEREAMWQKGVADLGGQAA
jgi:hypothetical protein